MSKNLEGQISLVKDGSPGIGAAIAKRWAAYGASVAVTVRRTIRRGIALSSPVVRSRNVLKRNSMRFAAALLAALAIFVAAPNAALAAPHEHHDQVPGF